MGRPTSGFTSGQDEEVGSGAVRESPVAILRVVKHMGEDDGDVGK